MPPVGAAAAAPTPRSEDKRSRDPRADANLGVGVIGVYLRITAGVLGGDDPDLHYLVGAPGPAAAALCLAFVVRADAPGAPGRSTREVFLTALILGVAVFSGLDGRALARTDTAKQEIRQTILDATALQLRWFERPQVPMSAGLAKLYAGDISGATRSQSSGRSSPTSRRGTAATRPHRAAPCT